MLRTPLARLRTVGIAEGVSYLLLLGIAMPLKYLAGYPLAVEVVGWVHGLLFMLYVAAVAEVMINRNWSLTETAVALVASVVPFGPFLLDRRLKREMASELATS